MIQDRPKPDRNGHLQTDLRQGKKVAQLSGILRPFKHGPHPILVVIGSALLPPPARARSQCLLFTWLTSAWVFSDWKAESQPEILCNSSAEFISVHMNSLRRPVHLQAEKNGGESFLAKKLTTFWTNNVTESTEFYS
jgi:hypothetical protein